MLSGSARRRDPWRALGRRDEMQIALAACATVRDRRARAGLNEIGQQFSSLIIKSDRSGRHSHYQIAALMTVLLLAASGFAVAGDESRSVLEIQQRRKTFINFE